MPPANAAAIDPSRQLLPFRESLLAMLGLACVAMLVALDQTIVGTAMPRIVAELKGFDLYAWVATSYMLASVITIPIFGRLGDLYGRKRFLVAAIVLFTVASVLCGRADSMLLLVIARGVQGIGGGILIGTIFASVADLFPDAQLRLRWLVFVSHGVRRREHHRADARRRAHATRRLAARVLRERARGRRVAPVRAGAFCRTCGRRAPAAP